MKLPKTAKIEKVIATDAAHPILQHPFLRIDASGAKLLASDKNAIVMIPVEVTDEDVSGQVRIEAVKEARKIAADIRCTPEHCILPNAVAYPRDVQHTAFPPIDQLLVENEQVEVEVAINAKTLYAIANAMGTDFVKLRIQKNTSALPIGVEPHPSESHVEGARAAMMPYRLPNSV